MWLPETLPKRNIRRTDAQNFLKMDVMMGLSITGIKEPPAGRAAPRVDDYCITVAMFMVPVCVRRDMFESVAD